MLHHRAGNAEVLHGTETCQPKHWEVRRKHIAYGAKGAASRLPARRGASKSKDGPPVKCKRLDARAERGPLRTML